MSEFRVATYNVLSSHLADPPRFPACEPKHLHAPTRLERVKAKLQQEVDFGSVICLQEVSTLWAGEFHVFFMTRGYAFVPANYGSSHSGYMGIALAWPLSKYDPVTVDIRRVSDTRTWGRQQEQHKRASVEPLSPTSPTPTAPPPAPHPSPANTPQRSVLLRNAAPPSPTSKIAATLASFSGGVVAGPGEGAEWGSPLKALMRLAGRGTKRAREERGSVDSCGGGDEQEDFWQPGPARTRRAPSRLCRSGTPMGSASVGDGAIKHTTHCMAEKRLNQALFVRLRVKTAATAAQNGAPNGVGMAPASSNGTRGTQGPVFCVGTYHMPCLFTHRPVMAIHTSMVIKHLVELASSDQLVIAGDFNFNPVSECYKIVTEGDLSVDSRDFPPRPEWEKDWSAATGVKLLSAYKEVDGKEPNFTNNAKVEEWPPFIDTLDYIFHTPGLTATKVLPLKHRDEVKGPFPIETEPSDHVLLAAEYRM